jgi:hypothetical protein
MRRQAVKQTSRPINEFDILSSVSPAYMNVGTKMTLTGRKSGGIIGDNTRVPASATQISKEVGIFSFTSA